MSAWKHSLQRTETATQRSVKPCEYSLPEGDQAKATKYLPTRRKVQFERNPKQGVKYNGKVPNHPRGEGLQEIENLIQRCLKEVVRQFGLSGQPPALPDPPKKPDDSPPSK